MRLVQRSGYITSASAPPALLNISSVNAGVNPYSNQTVVGIVGNGFSITQGTVRLDGVPLVILTWTDSLVEVAWADIPFTPSFSYLPLMPVARITTLSVVGVNGSDSRTLLNDPNPNAFYAVITSIPTGSLYSNDTGIELGADRGYIRILSGTVDSIDAATGVLSGISPGAVVEYAIFDTSLGLWSN